MKTNISRLLTVAFCLFLCTGFIWAAELPIFCPKAIRPAQMDTKKGYVVLILGPTSVGKTTISKQISGEVASFVGSLKDQPEIVQVAMDDEEDGSVSRDIRSDFPGWRDEHILLYQKIMAQAQMNKVVISDIMLFESNDYDITESFINKLKEKTNVFPTLVYCSMYQLVANIVSRNSSEDSLDSRSPDSAVDQFCEQFNLSRSVDEHDLQPIDSISPREIEMGIDMLGTSPVNASGRASRARCIQKLQRLHSTSPSPVMVMPKLYDFIIKNSGSSLEAGIAKICYALFKKIKETYTIWR